MITSRELVLESAHTFAIYTMLVPDGRLLKWADVMLYAVDALEQPDSKVREQAAQLFRNELERLVFEPIYALGKAIATNLPNEKNNAADVSTEIEKYRTEIFNTLKSTKKEIDTDEATPDFVALKYKIIDSINKCFAFLNKVQDFQYPEIKPSSVVLPEALKNA